MANPVRVFTLSPADSAFELAIDQITDDINLGNVPSSVSSFAELHDYVDANEYGGLDDVTIVGELTMDEMIDLGNALQARLDAWIKAGRPSV